MRTKRWTVALALSAVSAVASVGVSQHTANAGPNNTIPNPGGGCPQRGAAATTGDGDGDGRANDRQDDINGDAAGKSIALKNGTLDLWCIKGTYFALLWHPAGKADVYLIAKCPYTGGRNTDTYDTDAAGNLTAISWTSTDDSPNAADRTDRDGDPVNGDDDSDNQTDAFTYTYNPTTNRLVQTHSEMPHAGGPPAVAQYGPAEPPKRPFTFGSLLPKNPGIDDLSRGPAVDPCGKVPGLPTCRAQQVTASLTEFTVQSDDGLQAITVTTAVNADIDVPSFMPGTTDPVVVTMRRTSGDTPVASAGPAPSSLPPVSSDPVVDTTVPPSTGDPFDAEISVIDSDDTLPCGVSENASVSSPGSSVTTVVPQLTSVTAVGAFAGLSLIRRRRPAP